jgi:hypothetical protein
LKQFEEALHVQRVALGPDHHAVATTLMNIGNVYAVGTESRPNPCCR